MKTFYQDLRWYKMENEDQILDADEIKIVEETISTNSAKDKSFDTALKVFKYLFILYTLLYWVNAFIDDWKFIEKYWKTNWLEYLGIWLMYFIIFSIFLSLCYWIIASIFILVYHKIMKRIK